MIAAARLLPYEHMPCIAHILLRSITESFSDSRFSNVLAKCGKIVGHFKRLRAVSTASDPGTAAGWNSTLEMVKRLNRTQAAIKATLDQQHNKLVRLTPPE